VSLVFLEWEKGSRLLKMAMCIRVCQVGLGSPVVPYTPSLIILDSRVSGEGFC
jgi:hypothetical protein